MILIAGVTAGLLFGAGVTAVVWGLRPPLARLYRQVDAILGGRGATIESPWRRWRDQLATVTPDAARTDLLLLGRTPEDFVVVRLMWAVGGLVGVAAFAGVAGVPPMLVPIVALLGAVGGWYAAVRELHDRATRQRRTFALALASWTQMSALMIRAGVKDEQAMRRAAQAGSHWTFDLLASAMERAVTNHVELWAGLDELGRDTDVTEIRQLASELRLTENAGGTPTDALLAHADALRQDELANQLSAAKATKLKQDLVLGALGIVLVLYVIYPTVRTLLDSQM